MDVRHAEIGNEPTWVMCLRMTASFVNIVEQKLCCRLRNGERQSHGLRVSRGKTEYMPCPEKDQIIYIQEKEVSEDSVDVRVSGLIVRCQRRSRDRCKQQSKYRLVKVEGNYWGDVRQEHNNNNNNNFIY